MLENTTAFFVSVPRKKQDCKPFRTDPRLRLATSRWNDVVIFLLIRLERLAKNGSDSESIGVFVVEC